MAKTTEPKHKVVYRDLTELTPLEDNPRWIKEDDFNRLCASLQNNPDLLEAQPLILSDRTGELVIIAGNQRYKAAQTVGMKTIPTVLMSGLSEKKEKEIIIRTNVTNGRWDYDRLANGDWDVDELGDWGVDVSFMGEDDGTDLDDFFEDAATAKKEEEDKVEDIVLTVCIPGEEFSIKDEVKEALKAALEAYPNVSIK